MVPVLVRTLSGRWWLPYLPAIKKTAHDRVRMSSAASSYSKDRSALPAVLSLRLKHRTALCAELPAAFPRPWGRGMGPRLRTTNSTREPTKNRVGATNAGVGWTSRRRIPKRLSTTNLRWRNLLVKVILPKRVPCSSILSPNRAILKRVIRPLRRTT